MSPDLPENVREIIHQLFPPDHQAEVAALLTQHFVSRPILGGAERCCLAALKLSGGDLRRLRRTVKDNIYADERDLLIAAGFGDPTSHEAWVNQVKTESPKQRPEGPEGPEDMYHIEAVAACPKCRKEWPEGAAVCIECGYNFRTGKKLKTKRRIEDRCLDVGRPALGWYSRYAIHADAKGRRSLVIRSWFLWIPLGTTTVDLKGYDSVVTDHKRVTTRNSRYDWFPLALKGPNKNPRQIWSGSNEGTMHALVDFLREAAGLTIGRM